MRNAKKSNTKQRQNGRSKRNKEFEINVKDADVNFSDLSGNVNKRRESRKNDVAWYSKSPSLLRDAASFPYSWPVGSALPWKTSFAKSIMYSVAGLCVLDYTPGIGRSLDVYSPVNLAARNFFTYVRKANSGQTNYETSDLMMYLLSMDSAYQTYAVMVRAYGIATLYSQENRYLGKALLNALNFDAEDVYNNLAQLRYAINLLAYKLNNMCVPASVAYIQRHTWMASGLYADSQTPKAQIYAFNPMGYYTFTEVTEGPAYLRFDYFGLEQSWKVSTIVEAANKQLEAILASQDFNIMSGDILKAFGNSNLYTVPTIDENFVVLPAYNEEVLSQIENLVAVGTTDTAPGTGQDNPNNIVQKQNEFLESYIFYAPAFSYTMIGAVGNNTKYPTMHQNMRQLWNDKRIINMHKTDVTPADTMVATRLSVIAGATTDSDFNHGIVVHPKSFGTEVVNRIWLVQFNQQAESAQVSLSKTQMHYIDTVAPTISTDVNDNTKANIWLTRTGICSQFDWFPMHFGILNMTSDSDTSVKPSIPFRTTMDLDMYTMMDEHDLERLHEVALLSLFEVGQTGTKIGP